MRSKNLHVENRKTKKPTFRIKNLSVEHNLFQIRWKSKTKSDIFLGVRTFPDDLEKFLVNFISSLVETPKNSNFHVLSRVFEKSFESRLIQFLNGISGFRQSEMEFMGYFLSYFELFTYIVQKISFSLWFWASDLLFDQF